MQVAEIAEAAFECWWQEQHPGWMIFTLGNNHFESLDQIIKVQLSSKDMEALADMSQRCLPCSFPISCKCCAHECSPAGNAHKSQLWVPLQYSHGEGANIEGAIPIPKDNSAERTMSVRHISLYCRLLMLL